MRFLQGKTSIKIVTQGIKKVKPIVIDLQRSSKCFSCKDDLRRFQAAIRIKRKAVKVDFCLKCKNEAFNFCDKTQGLIFLRSMKTDATRSER